MKSRALTPAPRGFHGDRYLLELVERIAPRAGLFFETGSNVGSTVGDVARRYPELPCLSCEPDPEAFAVAHQHATVRPGVQVLEATSQELMARLEDGRVQLTPGALERPLFAWLDAHDFGFEWPLRDEVRFLTERFAQGFLLVDDFRVPHDARFGWDAYDGQSCDFEFVRGSIAPDVAYRLYYPAYSEHTSPWHPLRGWGLLQFGRSLEELERMEAVLPHVCRFDHERGASATLRAVTGSRRDGPAGECSLSLSAMSSATSSDVAPDVAPDLSFDASSPVSSPVSSEVLGGARSAGLSAGASGSGPIREEGASTAPTPGSKPVVNREPETAPSFVSGSRTGSDLQASNHLARAHEPNSARPPGPGPEHVREPASETEPATVPEVAELERRVADLRRHFEASPADATAWNDLAVSLAHSGVVDEALGALANALDADPGHPAAGANLRDMLGILRGAQGREVAVAPGPWGRMVARSPIDDVAALVDLEAPTIVDGGANRGDTVVQFRRHFPKARIHAFEPIEDLAEGIRARFADDGRLVVHAAALSASEGTRAFNRFANDRASSFAQPSAIKRRYQRQQVDVVDDSEVLTLTLDRAVPEPIDVLKLDVQGHELEALRGLGERIAEVRVLLLEVEFVPLFDGQPLFADVDTWVRAQGFRLLGLYDMWTHPDGQLTAGDAIYVNERYYA